MAQLVEYVQNIGAVQGLRPRNGGRVADTGYHLESGSLASCQLRSSTLEYTCCDSRAITLSLG